MVTYYRVTPLSWAIGKVLVDVPFYSMVNLIAGRQVVPELMQNAMTGERIAFEAGDLLNNPAKCAKMKAELRALAAGLAAAADPMELAAEEVVRVFETRGMQ
jgi:lipid-A-disaccharide synthase